MGGVNTWFQGLLLQPVCPIAGAALGMSDGDDLDVVEAFAEDDGIRIVVKEGATGAVDEGRANQRAGANFAVCAAEFLVQSKGRGLTAVPKIIEFAFCFCLGTWM